MNRFLVIAIFISTTLAQGQNFTDYYDAVGKATSPAEKAKALSQLAMHLQQSQIYGKALDYWNQAEALTSTDFASSKSIRLNRAICLSYLQQTAEAEEILKKLLIESNEQKDVPTEQLVENELARFYERQNRPVSAISTYEQMLLKSPTSEESFRIYNNLGYLYQKAKDQEKAIENFERALVIAKRISTPIDQLVNAYINLGTAYARERNFAKAQSTFDEALKWPGMGILTKAQLHNYRAASFMASKETARAAVAANASIQLAEPLRTEAGAEQILMDGYKLLSMIHQHDDLALYQKYNTLYRDLQDKSRLAIQKQNQSLFEKQIEIEGQEREFTKRSAEKELLDAQERERALLKEKETQELKLQLQEMDLLKRNQEFQRIELEKQFLEKRQAEQELEINSKKTQATLQRQELEKQQQVRESEKKLLEQYRNQKVLQERFSKEQESRNKLVFAVAVMSTLCVVLLLGGFVYQLQIRKRLIKQNHLIELQKDAIEKNNLEIRGQNEYLKNAENIIKQQNEQLTTYNARLEQEVAERTQALQNANSELADNNQQLEQYSYMTAHNLRGPVARILGLSSIFEHNDADSLNGNILKKMQFEAKSLDTLIKDLNVILNVRKAKAELTAEINIEEAWVRAQKILQQEIVEANAIVKSTVDASAAVYFVATYFENILYNLLSNAIKYRSADRQSMIELSLRTDGEYDCLIVSDNGLGIDLTKHQDKVFRLFSRFHIHKEGKGIGLYLIKMQMENLGGKVVLESKPDEYTRFLLFFKKVKRQTSVDENQH